MSKAQWKNSVIFKEQTNVNDGQDKGENPEKITFPWTVALIQLIQAFNSLFS